MTAKKKDRASARADKYKRRMAKGDPVRVRRHVEAALCRIIHFVDSCASNAVPINAGLSVILSIAQRRTNEIGAIHIGPVCPLRQAVNRNEAEHIKNEGLKALREIQEFAVPTEVPNPVWDAAVVGLRAIITEEMGWLENSQQRHAELEPWHPDFKGLSIEQIQGKISPCRTLPSAD